MLFVGMVGTDLWALRVIQALEFQLMQLSHNVLIWLMKRIRAASSRALLIILQGANAFFTIEHCACGCGAF